MERLKPKLVTATLAFLAAVLIYLSSPSLEGLSEYSYAFLVPVFTSIIAVFSLYFVHQRLSEVME